MSMNDISLLTSLSKSNYRKIMKYILISLIYVISLNSIEFSKTSFYVINEKTIYELKNKLHVEMYYISDYLSEINEDEFKEDRFDCKFYYYFRGKFDAYEEIGECLDDESFS